jgi:hypothetical protein
MRCFSLLLGARNTPAQGKRFTAGDDAQIRAITFRHFPDGFTVLNADGGWFNPDRKVFIEEESRQILVSAPSIAALRPWCAELGHALGQQDLLVIEVGPVTVFRMVSPPRGDRRRQVRSTRK